MLLHWRRGNGLHRRKAKGCQRIRCFICACGWLIWRLLVIAWCFELAQGLQPGQRFQFFARPSFVAACVTASWYLDRMTGITPSRLSTGESASGL